MKIIGLTGGIGSGKTTVANFFKELGVPVYIADDAGKRLMESSTEIKKEIIKIFGKEAYTDELPNRKFIASKVFNDLELLQKLNSIIHPAVGKDFEKWKNSQEAIYVIYEAAILFETGAHKRCDSTILVEAPKDLKITRLRERDQSTREEIEARMKNQWSDEKKEALASFIIKNEDLSSTKLQVKHIHLEILKAGQNSQKFC